MGAEHERGVDLGMVAQWWTRLGRRRRDPLGSARLGHHDPWQQLGHRVRGVRPDRQVDEHQVGVELRARRHQRAVGSHDQRVAVEDELVLAAHLVDVGNGAARLGHPPAQQGQTLGVAAPVVGRGVQVHDHVRPGSTLVRHGPVVEPHVLADGDADPRPCDTEERRQLGARHEPALLVEDAVVGQEALAVDPRHPSARADGGRVGQPVPPGRLAHEPDDDRALPRGGRHLLECGDVVGDEPRLEEQVLGGIPGDGELRDDAEIRPRRLGFGQGGQDPLDVAGQVAYDGVELRGSQAQVRHRSRIPARHRRSERASDHPLTPDHGTGRTVTATPPKRGTQCRPP